MPFLATFPGVFPAGLAFDHPVSSLDIFPTVAALSGVTPPANLDGVDLTPFLTGQKTAAPHDALYFAISGLGAVRSDRWKLVLAADGTPQLFDLTKDLEEKHDLASTEPARVRELTLRWKAWHAPMPAPPARKAAKESAAP